MRNVSMPRMPGRRSCPVAAAPCALGALAVLCCTVVLTAGDTIRVACVGTSITQAPYLDPTQRYPTQLQGMLGPGYLVGNFGVGGSCVMRYLDVPYCTTSAFRSVFTFSPDWIVLEQGTNDSYPWCWDSLDSCFPRDFRFLLDTFRTIPTLQYMWLCTPPPVFSKFNQIDSGVITERICPMVRRIAQEENLGLAEVHDQLLDFPEVFSIDGVHPNGEGCFFIATVVYNALTSPGHVRRRPAGQHTGIGVGAITYRTVVRLRPPQALFAGSVFYDFLGRSPRLSAAEAPSLTGIMIATPPP